ncbi:MAG: fumarylacetoacetate hydrolase family protein [Bacteroidetes bacterium]|nr:fumarylacetoacetate hydrolase family protein [Bacteroidota bacterium]
MKIGRFLNNSRESIGIVYNGKWLEGKYFSDILGDVNFDSIISYLTLSQSQKERIEYRLNSMGENDIRFHNLADSVYFAPVSEYTNLYTLRGSGSLASRVMRLKNPTQPVFDLRYSHNLSGHNCTTVLDDNLISGGWNIELVAVISKEASHIHQDEAFGYIGGYTILIDHSSAHKKSPFYRNDLWKMDVPDMEIVDHFYKECGNGNVFLPVPIGPVITTSDEILDPKSLMVRESEKGRLVSVGSSENLMHGFDELIAYMSRFITLKPGDMLSSSSITFDGYPHWNHYEPESYIQVEIEKIGALRMNILEQRSALI